MEREIVVKGEGEGRSLPDRAVIGLSVEAQSPSRDTAYEQAAATARRIDEVIESHRGALGRVTTAALVVQQTTRWDKGEYLLTGWRAGRTTRLEVTGFDQLGAMVAELTGAGGAISGPRWEIDAGNPVHRDTRQAAALDARRRAEDYAAALGLQIAGVAWISEPGLRGPSLGADHSIRALSAEASAPLHARGEDVDEVIEVTPEELTTWASVEVGFSLAVQSPGATA